MSKAAVAAFTGIKGLLGADSFAAIAAKLEELYPVGTTVRNGVTITGTSAQFAASVGSETYGEVESLLGGPVLRTTSSGTNIVNGWAAFASPQSLTESLLKNGFTQGIASNGAILYKNGAVTVALYASQTSGYTVTDAMFNISGQTVKIRLGK